MELEWESAKTHLPTAASPHPEINRAGGGSGWCPVSGTFFLLLGRGSGFLEEKRMPAWGCFTPKLPEVENGTIQLETSCLGGQCL